MATQFFGAFLVERGLATQAQVDAAAAYQVRHNKRMGDYALEKGYMSPDDVDNILREQMHIDLRFGEMAEYLGVLTPAQIDEILAQKEEEDLRLGDALVALGHLDRARVDAEAERFHRQQSPYSASGVFIDRTVKRPKFAQELLETTVALIYRFCNLAVKVDPGCRWTRASPWSIRISR